MAQVGMVTDNKLAETLDEFLSADNATQTEGAARLLSLAYMARANTYRDAAAGDLQMPESARQDYIRYYSACAEYLEHARLQIVCVGEKLVMPA